MSPPSPPSPTSSTPLTEEHLRDRLRAELARLLAVEPGHIGDDDRFVALGVDSLLATRLAGLLAEATGSPVPPALLWAYPSVGALAHHLVTGPGTPAEPPPADGMGRDEPIAVVGMACRFPGADDLDAFWELLTSGTDAVRPVPVDRWRGGRNRTPAEAGFLDGPVDAFDPLFFGISPREAAEMDPQQRLVLEVAWEAIEQAGLSAHALRGSRTGVFAGAIWHDFADLRGADGTPPTPHSATGQALNMVANRLSYTLGLRGPSLTVDSACSSSLLALHLACRSIREGESEAALVGGVNLLLNEGTMESLTRFGGLSPDGRCKAFDASGDGFGRGEGCGVVVLKPLSRALADGDRIWCLIRGSAVNNDGPSNGLTAPDPLAQEDVLRRAYGRAGISPADVHYVETHGTGTALGDPIEASALGAVFGPDRTDPLVIGAVKTNIGHLEGAAGIAGLIKTALCLSRAHLPANLHFTEPNPHIDFDALRLRVPTSVEEWPRERRLAGVSSFGWGGTNVHVVLSAWQEPEPLPAAPEPLHADGPRIGFVCSPHGHQWVGMGRHMLRTEPVFRSVVERCDRALAPLTGWSVLRTLHEDDVDFGDVSVTQPVLFAMQVALAAWLEEHGVRPDVVCGHSLGEIPAAVIAGFLDIPEAARLVHHYSRHQARIAGRGEGMAIVELSAARLAEELPAGSPLVVATHNGPSSTALAGPLPALQKLLAALKAQGVLCSLVKVDVAAHSPAVDEIYEDLVADIAELAVSPGRLPMISTLTTRQVTAADLTAEYFARNLREPVRLAEVTAGMLADGCEVLVEVSAHPVLLTALQQSARQAAGDGGHAEVLAGMCRGDDDRDGVRETLDRLAALGAVRDPWVESDAAELFVLSAATGAALREAARRSAEALEAVPQLPMAELAAEARGRAVLPYRLAAVARSAKELAGTLRRHAEGAYAGGPHASARPTARAPKTVFVFPGQGSQWVGMGRELLATEPVFAAAIRRCDAAAAPYLDWSILAELEADETTARLDRIDVVQPLLFAMEVALAELWQSWGVAPDAVVGHSMGEVAAAYIAGGIRLEDAARVICLRSKLMRGFSGQGAMLAVELTAEEAARAVGERRDLVSVAVSNSRRSTVLSGDRDRLREIHGELTGREVFCRWVKVDVASHSPQMDALEADLTDLLSGVSGRTPRVPVHSTVTGRLCEETDFGPSYWFRNLRLPVLFGARIEELVRDGHTVFVEMSPHPVLLPAVEQAARDAAGGDGRAVRAVPSLRRDESARGVLLDSLGALHVLGVPAELERAATPARPASVLPLYPWQRERFPLRSGAPASRRDATLLGARLDPVPEPDVHYWQPRFDPRTAACADHVVSGTALAPGSLIVDLMAQAAREILPGGGLELTKLRFRRPVVAREPGRRLQLALRHDRAAGWAGVQLFDAESGAAEAVAGCAAEARVRALPVDAVGPRLDVEAVAGRLAEGADPASYYRRLAEQGLVYGPAYRRVDALWHTGMEVYARVVPAETDAPLTSHWLDPTLLDAALHVAPAAVLDKVPDGIGLVSAGVERVRVHRALTGACFVHAVVRPATGGCRAAVRVYDLDGAPLLEATGVTLLRREFAVVTAGTLARVADVPGESRSPEPTARSVRDSLHHLADEAQRRAAVQAHTAECVAAVARMAHTEVDADLPLRALGIDSLMLLELRNRLEGRFGITVTTAQLAKQPTLRQLSLMVAELADIPLIER